MKSRFFLLIILALPLFECGDDDECKPAPCKTTDNQYSANVNGFDFSPTAPYGKQAITTFKFDQKITLSTSPNSCTNCPIPTGSINLTIANNTPSTLTFDYSIMAIVGLAKWNYQGVATISPMSSTSVGEISKAAQIVTAGSISIVSNSITYK